MKNNNSHIYKSKSIFGNLIISSPLGRDRVGILLLISLCISTLHAQSKLNSATLGMVQARHLGPSTMSGRITAIEGINAEPRIMYVGTGGGGVWKTTTGGAQFEPVFDKYCQSIGALAIDQAHPDTVWVGTGESNMRNSVSVGDGLYRTTDGGENWTKIGLEKTEHISKVVLHPKNSSIIFVAAPGHLWNDDPNRGLYRSNDFGKTWTKTLYINEKTGCSDIIIDPSNPDIMYATTWEFRRQPFAFNSGGAGSGIYKSTDAGLTWRKIKIGLPEGDFGRVALAIAPSAPNNLLAIVESKKTGLYISNNGGENWKEQASTWNVCARPFYFSTLVVDPIDPKRVYRPAYSFSISTDGGYSFAEPNYGGGGVHSDHHALWINPKNTSQLFLGTDGGVYTSNDRGYSWNFLRNLPVGQFYHATFDNATPYNVYGGLQDNGSWSAPSQKVNGIRYGDWKDLFGGDGFWVQPDEVNSDFIYAEYQGGNMARINTKTNEAVIIQPQPLKGEEKLRWNWNTPIVKSPTNPKVLYTGAQYLYRTENQGNTWARISPDLTTNDKNKLKQEESGGLTTDNSSAENHCTIFTVAESILDPNMIWVGTDDGNLQLSNDVGKTWMNLTDNYAKSGIPKGAWVSSIEPSRFDKKVVYVSFENHTYGDMNTYIGKSSDGGKTWTRLNSPNFTGFAHKIKEDVVNRNLLFVGTEMGLFVSIDGGAAWTRYKANMPAYCLVRDIVINPKTNDVILATHGRGIMIIDDISPLRQLSDELLSKEFSFLENRPVEVTAGRYGYAYAPNAGEFVANNYTEDAVITYYLKDRVNSGEVKIQIYDEKGTFLYEIPATKRKGINKVTWNMRMAPPKTAKTGAQLDYGGFSSPMVTPGKYKIRFVKDDKFYDNTLTLVEPKNSAHTQADREQQRKTARELYTLVEELNFEMQRMVNVQTQVKGSDEKVTGADDKKLLQEYTTQLESVRKTLVATTEGTAITGEERLREKLSELFARVGGYEGRPTDSQVERVKGIEFEMQQKSTEITTVNKKYLDKVNAVLKKAGLPEIKLLTKEEFLEVKEAKP